MNKNIFILIAVIIVGLFLRFYQLGAIPGSLNWDEVSWGYNAYSIAQTGKDEHGQVYPFSFTAFGDYKQPVYVYLDAIAVSIFGLNAFAVRLPSALFGTLTILFVYFFVKELFRQQELGSSLALLAALFFALSPWSIQFSRVAFEANIGVFFTISGTWLVLRSMRLKQYWAMLLGIFIISVSSYTYHSQKIFTPLLFAGLLVYGYKVFGLKKIILLMCLSFFVICNLLWIIDPRTTSRGRSVTFFSDSTQLLQKSTEKLIYDKEHNDHFGAFFHNRRLVYAKKYFENYLMHFDPNYLFLTGDNQRHHAPRMGIVYLSLLPFIFAGIYFFLSKRVAPSYLLFFWMLIAPLSSALTINAPNASRSLVSLPMYEIFAGAGLFFTLSLFSRTKLRTAFLVLSSCIILGNVIYYAHMYFAHTNTDFGQYWQDGYKEAVLFEKEHRRPGQTVLFAKGIEQSYIFYLFYNRYDPGKFQGVPNKNKPCQKIENVYFGECNVSLKTGDVLITSDEEAPDDYKTVKTITYANGKKAVSIYEKL